MTPLHAISFHIPCLQSSAFALNNRAPKFHTVRLKLASVSARYHRASSPVCLFGGKGKPDNGNEEVESPWKSVEKAIGNLNSKSSIEDVLRDQIQKQEFYDEGGGGDGKPPRRGGGGGGDGEVEDESFAEMADEFMQVVLATMGFIFLYMFILEGEDITVFAKDLIKFVFSGQKSIRLRRLVNQWRDFLESMKEEEVEPYWLERTILETRTSYDGPEKYDYIIRKRPDLLYDFFRSAPDAASSHRDKQD